MHFLMKYFSNLGSESCFLHYIKKKVLSSSHGAFYVYLGVLNNLDGNLHIHFL